MNEAIQNETKKAKIIETMKKKQKLVVSNYLL